MLHLFKRNPLHLIARNRLPFLHLNLISNGAAGNPQTILSPFILSFSSAPSNLQHESPKLKNPVLDFFHSYGFTDPQIKRFLHKSWSVSSIATMKPKLEHLIAFGFSPSELVKLICYDHKILTTRLHERIEPNLKLLEATIVSKTHIIQAIKHGPWLLRKNLEKCVIPNVWILRECIITTETINLLFMRFPHILLKDPSVIIETIDKLKGLGMSPSTAEFIQGMNFMAKYKKETWERKLELYRSLGWSDKDTLSVFSRQPTCLQLSDDKIKEKVEFFKERLQWDSAILAKQPVLLMYSMEGRIIPRCAVLTVLAQRKLWNGRPSLFTVFHMGEKKFEERFVEKYDKEVSDAYQGKVEFTEFHPSVVLNQSQARDSI